MNIEEIDKWLDNEYGVSYTRLEELHDFVVEQDLKHCEEKDKEIERLNNILDEIDLIFYRMRFVEFNSIKDELKFLYENINTVRKICQNKKLEILDKGGE